MLIKQNRVTAAEKPGLRGQGLGRIGNDVAGGTAVKPFRKDRGGFLQVRLINSALEPDRPRGAPPFFVTRRESVYGLNPAANDATGDPDWDYRNNLAEYGMGTNPQDDDTDGGGMARCSHAATIPACPLSGDDWAKPFGNSRPLTTRLARSSERRAVASRPP